MAAKARPIWPAVRAGLAGVAIIGVLLVIPAGLAPGGSWVWPRALVFALAYGAINTAGSLVLAIWRPAHFRIRRQGVVAARGKRQPRVDAVGSVALLVFAAGWVAFIPLDVFALRLLAPPSLPVALAGLAVAIAGMALTPLAVWENRFATPNVQQQDDQAIVRTGIYRLIRHPIYLGNLLLTVGAPLWLGSYASLWGAAMYLVATIGRIAIEEKELKRRLPAYADYARQVRARLIPFVI